MGLGFADAAAWTEGANALDEALGLAYRSALGYVFLDDSAILEAALRSHNVVQFDSAVLAGMRIERGIPLGRVDFDEKTLALEIGQTSRAIHFKKGCYLGQEVVARIDARGHTNRGLVGFTSARVLTPGSRALSDGKDVGWITSSAIGPTRGTPVALGYLRHESAVAKTEVQVGGESAQVIALPFVGAMS